HYLVAVQHGPSPRICRPDCAHSLAGSVLSGEDRAQGPARKRERPVAEIWRVTDWRLPAAIGPLYESLIGAIGSDEFGATIRHCVEELSSGVRRLYLFEASGRGEDALHYYHCEPHIAEQLPAYAMRYKPLDPIGDLYAAAPRVGDLAIQRVRPTDIASAGFRRRFFDGPGIVERVSLIQRNKSGWCGMNVSRHAS